MHHERRNMAKKAELILEAQKLKLEVSEKNTIAEIQAAIDNVASKPDVKAEVKLAKAGHRSAKGIKEAEEKQAKLDHQKHKDEAEAEEKPAVIKQPAPKTRSRLERRGKKYQTVHKLIDKSKEYNLADAIDLAIKTNPTAFNASVELHVRLGVDPRQADQNIRGTVNLPAGTGKKVRVAVFAPEDLVEKAKVAGADIAAADEFLQQLDKEQFDFDVLISTPQMMAKLGKYARVLGPKGLMPNPKSGTVTKDVAAAVKQAKAGKVEYRVDSTGIVHLGVGKTNFKAADLVTNTQTVVDAIKAAKPTSLKVVYIQSAFITTTMGPSIRLATSEL